MSRWAIEFSEKLPVGDPEASDRSLLVEPLRHVQFESVEAAVAPAAEEPALDDQ